MVGPPWRVLGIAAVGAASFALPASLAAAPAPRISTLRAHEQSIERQKRSAVLSLYSLDSRLAAADARLAALERREAALRAQRVALVNELRLARVDAHLSQRRLAARLRSLYDHPTTTTVDLLFGATSLTDAVTQLDNLQRVASLNDEIVVQLHSARVRELAVKSKIAARETRLQAAIQAAGTEARSLASVRAARSSYVARLSAGAALDAQQIARIEAQAREAQTKAQQLTRALPAAPVAQPVAVAHASGNARTVVATGYCLTGTTATGIPVGWGVAAVDPGVIPLGTHLTIPGYGEAVAADTGGAIVGNRIDLWFPSCGQAGGWGSRSVTIALH